MFRLTMLFAGLCGLLASRPGKPMETLLVRLGRGGVFFQRTPASFQIRLGPSPIKKPGALPAFWFCLPRHPGS